MEQKPRRLKVKIGERWYTVEVERLDINPIVVTVDGETMEVDVSNLASASSPEAEMIDQDVASPVPEDGDVLRAPMPGVILRLNVQTGEQVAKNQVVCVLEAMKMEVNLQAPRDGVIKAIHVRQGDNVTIGQKILDFS
jgi:biotin carboxyl carrier protein